uniref:NTR domain-containing protein n=1 Tax=Magallana gigas TaxID=29159 RepID=A0A8W8MD05_MAGGI|nr:uncharacterized protein LOC105342749 [Crassostrea gigas]
MELMKYGSLLVFVTACFGCDPSPKVQQDDFCYANFVFEAKITSRNIGELNIEYGFDVQAIYKGTADNIPSTLVGDGYFMSCGPQELKVNTFYLIFAKHQSGGAFQIVDYYNMANVKNTDIERITTKYDCDCIINIDDSLYGYVSGAPKIKPSKEACITPANFCPRSGFCRKNVEGACTWGNHGECY